jgi:hypothetical protein
LDELTAADTSAASIQIAAPPFEIERSSPTPPPSPSPAAPPAAQAAEERDEDAAPEELVSPTLAQLYLRQGHYAQAVRVYDELLRREPQNETYQQAHSIALTLLQGQEGASAGSATKSAGSIAAGPGEPSPSAAPPAPRSPRSNDRIINKLQSWLLHIQQQRRRRAS